MLNPGALRLGHEVRALQDVPLPRRIPDPCLLRYPPRAFWVYGINNLPTSSTEDSLPVLTCKSASGCVGSARSTCGSRSTADSRFWPWLIVRRSERCVIRDDSRYAASSSCGIFCHPSAQRMPGMARRSLRSLRIVGGRRTLGGALGEVSDTKAK